MSSSSSDAEVHAKWTKTGFCSCSIDNYYCKHIQHKVVPMSSDFSRGAVNVGRFFAAVFTISLSTIVNGGIKGLEHDCVELEVHCQKCGKTNNAKINWKFTEIILHHTHSITIGRLIQLLRGFLFKKKKKKSKKTCKILEKMHILNHININRTVLINNSRY